MPKPPEEVRWQFSLRGLLIFSFLAGILMLINTKCGAPFVAASDLAALTGLLFYRYQFARRKKGLPLDASEKAMWLAIGALELLVIILSCAVG